MAVVEQYWSGVLARLQSEVDVLNRLIKHWGEQGIQNELSLARVIESLVPKRYGIGSGMLIDSKDGYSQQTDIVIFDHADQPTVLAQTTQILFPIEGVRACIEVKTTVSKEEIIDSAEKHASIMALKSMSQQPEERHSPMFALVGYHGGQHPETLASHLKNLEESERPDLVCVVNAGFLAGRADVLLAKTDQDKEEDYVAGIVPLHDLGETGERTSGAYVSLPADFASEWYLRNGTSYPIVKHNRGWLPVEPSRALLLFCESLVRMLAIRDGRPVPSFTHYVQGSVREIVSVWPEAIIVPN